MYAHIQVLEAARLFAKVGVSVSYAVLVKLHGRLPLSAQDETLRHEVLMIDVDQDGSVVLSGGMRVTAEDWDFAVWKLDPDGVLLWEFQVRVHAPRLFSPS